MASLIVVGNELYTYQMDKGTEGFEGGMTAKKYMGITKVSKATATRDLQQLQEKGILVPEGAGRSVHYQINML